MGLGDRIRKLQLRAWQAWRAWRGQPRQEPSEDQETDLNWLFPENEEDSQREEIQEAMQHDLEGDFDALTDSLRGHNGDK
jgi:hypothetical protein